ncbi:nitroreductase family protein [Dehalobacterium formicoaceticum]|uniref:Nitroreductase family protein n=1 Tax=Dehalobacterium formicoaceticum TaxID=51515 RepID=A0ABT1Y549_9FIRM|nr:nitroreductase family protein [Dehalobacterium formicoaceticum]MCR6546003.1 nitroreductase family protein [Dehalobacterium formicoaceticum]
MEWEDVLYMRRTTRKYQPHQIEDDDLERILDAAQMAPTAMGNEKTTHLTVVQDVNLLNRIREVVQLTSRKTGQKMDAFYGAPTVIFLSAADLSEDHIEYSDVACLIENMMLQATALNLGSTYIWGCLPKLRNNAEVLKELQLPANYEILSAVAVGYSDKPLVRREKRTRISMNRI